MRNSIGGDMLFWIPEGPQIEYRDETLFIADLNPQVELQWRVSAKELFVIGLKCIWASIRPSDGLDRDRQRIAQAEG